MSISLAESTAFRFGILWAPFARGLVSIYFKTGGDYQKNQDKIKENYFNFHRVDISRYPIAFQECYESLADRRTAPK
jgi:hypothetical protein